MGTRLDVTDDELRTGLFACLAVPRWVDEVAAAGPYSTLDRLLDEAGDAATPLSAAEVDQALEHHPRIGERARGVGAAQRFSRAEQASGDAEDADLGEALAAGNRAYEAKFGRVFLIRAAGRSRADILSELRRRLELAPDDEVAVAGGELRDIALLRIPQLFTQIDQHSGPDSGAAR